MKDEIIKKLRKKFDNLGITKAVIIDDKIEVNENEIILEILEDNTNRKFDVFAEMSLIGYPDIAELKEQVAEDETPPEVKELLLERFPDKFISNLTQFKELLEDIFPNNVKFLDTIITGYEDSKPIYYTFESDTVLFLDYQLEEGDSTKSEQYTKFLSTNNVPDSRPPRCIIFISNRKDFIINDEQPKNVDMLKPRDKSRYFSYIRSKQEEFNYRNSLYDYIHKKELYIFEKAAQEIMTIIENFSTGRLFYNLLDNMNKMIDKSSDEVFNKFRLLNARSLNEILSQKIAKEGEDESVFLINWLSRLVAKTLIQSGTNLQEISKSLNDITNLSNTHHELHEDVAIQEIINLEMWDSTVNERYCPIDFGDIFKIQYEEEELHAMLLTQTCTLAVRGDSKRAGQLGLLAIQTTKKKDNRPSVVSVELVDGKKVNFDLDDTISIPLQVLDLTTINKNGKAIIKRVDPVEKQFPEDSHWTKGYRTMLKKQINKMLDKLSTSNGVIELGRMLVPYINTTEETIETYNFKLRRIARLDSTYTMDVFQRMQSWWGRIGLPASVNFMKDYVRESGKIIINGETIPSEFHVKYQNKNSSDVAISIDAIVTGINNKFNTELESNIRNFLGQFLESSELTCLHYASSGLALMKLRGKGYDKVKRMFESKGLSIEFNNTEGNLELELNVFTFDKISLNRQEITRLVTNYSLNKDNLFEFTINKNSQIDGIIEYLEPFKINEDTSYITIAEDKKDLTAVFRGKEVKLKIKNMEEEFAAATKEKKS